MIIKHWRYKTQRDRNSGNERSVLGHSGTPPQRSHHPSPLIYPLIICELVGGAWWGRGRGGGCGGEAGEAVGTAARLRQYRHPRRRRRRRRDENGIENHQTNLLPFSRVLATFTLVCVHTRARVRDRPPARLTPPRSSARSRARACAFKCLHVSRGGVRTSRVQKRLPFK